MSPRIVSLCSGYGGLDLAAEALTGGRVVAHAEVDPHASTVLAHRWPGVPNVGDVWTADLPDADVITAGYPCQPFSLAGRRKGTDDPRHLWPAIRAAVRDLRPGLVLLENVAGHLSLGFDVVVGDLAALGFDAQWGVLRASDVGACHARARLWIAACPHVEGAGWDVGAVSGAVQGWAGGHVRAVVDGGLLPTPHANDGRGARSDEALARGRQSGGCSNLKDMVRELNLDGWGKYAAAVERHARTTGIAPPAPTVTGRNGQPALSPAFVEWMMMLRPGWVTDLPIPRTAAVRMLGNGVVPAQAFAAFAQLLCRDRPSDPQETPNG